MKKGEIYKGIVDAIDFPNKGILWIDGEKVIVKNVLPGQEIRFAVNKKPKKIDVAAAAATFGGGGHTLAAGCVVSGKYEDVVDKLLKAVTDGMPV